MAPSRMTLGVRTPRRDPARADGLRRMRDLQVGCLALCVPALAAAIVIGAPRWATVLGAVALGALLLDSVLLTRRIRSGGKSRRGDSNP